MLPTGLTTFKMFTVKTQEEALDTIEEMQKESDDDKRIE
jgi:hypothetical protein